MAANTCGAGPGKTKVRCGMEGEGFAGSAGSLSPALFAPRLTRACKMRKSKEKRGWGGMVGGLSPFPRRDGRALQEGWGLKSRRLQGDLRLIILCCKSWLMSNQGLGRRGGRGGSRGIPRGKGLLSLGFSPSSPRNGSRNSAGKAGENHSQPPQLKDRAKNSWIFSMFYTPPATTFSCFPITFQSCQLSGAHLSDNLGLGITPCFCSR